MSARTSTNGERQGFDSLPAELQQDIILRVLRSDDVESSAAALLLVSKAWSQMVQPDRCVMELYRRDAHILKVLASASMLDAEVREGVFPEGPDDGQQMASCRPWKNLYYQDELPWLHSVKRVASPHDDGQLTTVFSQWERLRCLQLRQLHDLRCLASLRASSLRACMLEELLLDLDDVAALGAALHAATALEHLAVIKCDSCWDSDQSPLSLQGHLLTQLQRCYSLRALELQIQPCLDLASLPQLTHFHWAVWDMAGSNLGALDLTLGSSLASLTLQPYEGFFNDAEAAGLARMLTRNSTIRSLELDVREIPTELQDALCSMTGVTRFVTNADEPFYVHLRAGMLALSSCAITERLIELRLHLTSGDTLLLPPRLTSLVLDFDDFELQSLQTFANVGYCRALRRLRLSGVHVALIKDHVLSWLDCFDQFSYWQFSDWYNPCTPPPSKWLLCDLKCWAAHVDDAALAVQFFCRYVVSPLSKLTELELLIDDFPSEADRAEVLAAAACPISWVRVRAALTQNIVGVPERFRRRVRRAA